MSPKRGLHLRELNIPPLDVFQGELAYTSGRYYIGVPEKLSPSDQGSVDDQLRTSPFFVSRDIQIDRIGVHVLTAQATGSTRLGIYESGDDGLPHRLLIDAGTVDTSTTGFKEITIAVTLRGPRIYFTSYVHNVDGIGLRSRTDSRSFGFAAGGDTIPGSIVNKTHTFGVLPDPFGAASVGPGFDSNAIYLRVV